MALHAPLVTELVSFGCDVYPAKPDRWPRHVHAFHQFDATVAGEVFVDLDGGRKVRSRAGDGLLIPPLVWHAHRTRAGFEVGMFKFRLAARHWRAFGARPRRIRVPGALIKAIREAGARRRAGKPWAEHQAIALLTLCLVEAPAPEPAQDGIESLTGFESRLWPLLERVESRPFDAWSVEGLAQECHLTPDHFTRRFEASLRLSPRQYLLEARIRASARALLEVSAPPIKELAAESGYGSVHAFTRAFKRVMGAGPAAFRRGTAEL